MSNRLTTVDQHRLKRARNDIEDEITKSGATPEQKALLRQRVMHLWHVITGLGLIDGQK